jgi:hypothetical protein
MRRMLRLVPIKATQDRKCRRVLFDAARTSGASGVTSGPSAACSQDFLYGDDGLDVTSKPPGCVYHVDVRDNLVATHQPNDDVNAR